MEYEVRLDVFHGPLDLLLHLIEKEELDIQDIPIALITEKYFSYLQTMQTLNLDGVGDFLVMAATLMQIKAQMLLPQLRDSEAEREFWEEDPRLELARKLIEYKKIKEASLSLQDLEAQQLRVYTRSGGAFSDLQTAKAPDTLGKVTLGDLVKAFETVLASLEKTEIKAVPKQELTIKQRMEEILTELNTRGEIAFKAYFRNVGTKLGIISCFLAVLELIRLNEIMVAQELVFGEIVLRLPKRVESIDES